MVVGDIKMDETTLAIIGTAGRKTDADLLSIDKYNEMYQIASKLIDYIETNLKRSITHLVSGGAAYADHLAVQLYLNDKVPNLRLFLPCDFKDGEFVDEYDMLGRTAETATFYHKKFSEKIRIDSIKELKSAIDKGAEVIVINGFKNRNTYVSRAEFLVAMTFGKGRKVKDGGTLDTVEKYLDRIITESLTNHSFHVDLHDCSIHKHCQI